MGSLPPTADRNDMDMGVHPLRTAVFRAREAEPSAANPGRALGRRRLLYLAVGGGAGAAGVRRLELWGLCRQQRIATTWTWEARL